MARAEKSRNQTKKNTFFLFRNNEIKETEMTKTIISCLKQTQK